MDIIEATKNISILGEEYGIILAIRCVDQEWYAAFEEDREHKIKFDVPIKVMHKTLENKTLLKSFKEYEVSKDLILMLDKVINLFDNAPSFTKRVLL